MATRKISLIGLLTGLLLLCSLVSVKAVEDGAYTISCTPTYTNPLTGKTEDGGTNIALGDSMVTSIVENQLLVEQTGGKLYLTIGLGLASNLSNVRFMVMNQDGSMDSTSAVITGSSTANGDTVNHYRIEISSLTQMISPILYVTPMGRDVQFFVQLNAGSLTPGTGIYHSEMIPVATSQPTAEKPKETTESPSTAKPAEEKNTQQEAEKEEKTETKETKTEEKDKGEDTQQAAKSETVTKESLFHEVKGLSTHEAAAVQKTSETKWTVLGIGAGIVVLALGLGGYYYGKKIKK